jgi:hypothetical protein
MTVVVVALLLLLLLQPIHKKELPFIGVQGLENKKKSEIHNILLLQLMEEHKYLSVRNHSFLIQYIHDWNFSAWMIQCC